MAPKQQQPLAAVGKPAAAFMTAASERATTTVSSKDDQLREEDNDAESVAASDDGGSLSSEGEYDKDVVGRLYRPPTTSDSSAYSLQLPARRQRRKQGGGGDVKPSKVVDYATYSKQHSTAETARATSAATSTDATAKKKEQVDDKTKALYLNAFQSSRQAAANAKSIPDIDFAAPGAFDDYGRLRHDPSVYGGVSSHVLSSNIHAISTGQTGTAAIRSAAQEAASASRPGTASNNATRARRAAATGGGAGQQQLGDYLDGDEIVRRRQEQAAAERAAAQDAQLERMKAEAEATEDPAKREYLLMMVALRAETLAEQRSKDGKGNSATAQPAEVAVTQPTATAAVDMPTPNESKDTSRESVSSPANNCRQPQQQQKQSEEKDPDYDSRVDQVAAALKARAEGKPYDPRLLDNVLDTRAVSALASADARRAAELELAATERRDRQFYEAVETLEQVVASDGLARLVTKQLDKHRFLFQRSKPARERGEYSHDEHAAFREFAELIQEYLFSRVIRRVGEPFDIEDFFTRVFEEEEEEDDDDAGPSSGYPLLSNSVWEILLAMLNFESFAELMDHHIFSRNKTGAAAASSAAAFDDDDGAASDASSSAASSSSSSAAKGTLTSAKSKSPPPPAAAQQQRPAGGSNVLEPTARRVGSADAATMGSRQSSNVVLGADIGSVSSATGRRDRSPPPGSQQQQQAPLMPTPPRTSAVAKGSVSGFAPTTTTGASAAVSHSSSASFNPSYRGLSGAAPQQARPLAGGASTTTPLAPISMSSSTGGVARGGAAPAGGKSSTAGKTAPSVQQPAKRSL